MDYNNVINLMFQQAKALKDIEDLLAHDAKRDDPGHSVKPEDIEALRVYSTNMKTAVDAAAALAKYYRNTAAKTEKPAESEEKPPKKKPAKKPDPPKEEPAPEEEFDFLD